MKSKLVLGMACRAALVVGTIMAVSGASANIVINPIFGNSITSNANKVAIEQGINNAIAVYQNMITNNATVTIQFENMNSGLGQSQTFINVDSYQDYRARLIAQQTSATDATAVAHLPNQVNDPATNHVNVILTLALGRGLGLSGANWTNSIDSTIGINSSLCDLDRSNGITAGKYDFQAVAMHEIDEVLGTSSWVGGPDLFNGTGFATGADMFRYDNHGLRAVDTNPNRQAWFSLDGTNLIQQYNQTGNGDYGDWIAGNPPHVQNAFGTPGVQVDLQDPELKLLDAVGWNYKQNNPVPEPASMAALGLGIAALIRRRRKA